MRMKQKHEATGNINNIKKTTNIHTIIRIGKGRYLIILLISKLKNILIVQVIIFVKIYSTPLIIMENINRNNLGINRPISVSLGQFIFDI